MLNFIDHSLNEQKPPDYFFDEDGFSRKNARGRESAYSSEAFLKMGRLSRFQHSGD